MEKTNFLKYAAFALSIGFFAACSDDNNDDNGGGGAPTVDPKEMSFIIVSGNPKTDLEGGVCTKVYNDLTATLTNESVYADSANEKTMKCRDTYTQVSWNKNTKTFTGYIYGRGGQILMKGAGLRSYKVEDGKMVELKDSIKFSAFGNSGTFGDYSYAAQISQPNVTVATRNGDQITGGAKDINLPQYAIDQVNPNISNIVDMGNNQIAMVVNYSNRDSAAVAICDYNFNISKMIYDARIGKSVGAKRSVRYAQSGADDEGNVYVFSGSGITKDSTNAGGVGVIRIKAGTTEFDKDYFFDIAAVSDKLYFRQVEHISGSYFLVDFFLKPGIPANMDASGKWAVVDVANKTLTWVSGLPDASTVSFGWPDGYNGVAYLPVAAPTQMSGGQGGGGGRPRAAAASVTPTVYAIDAKTGKATAQMTFKDSDLLKAIVIVK